MVVVVLTACPSGLRGDLTRWLFEISSGVFVGHVTARVRDKLWERIQEQIRSGRAIMVYSARNEQHLAFRTHHSDWLPIECEGLELIRRPQYSGENSEEEQQITSRRTGWSRASKYRRARHFSR